MAADGASISTASFDGNGWMIATRPATGDELIVCRCDRAPDSAALELATNAVLQSLSAGEGT
jgi:hypothetical protein